MNVNSPIQTPSPVTIPQQYVYITSSENNFEFFKISKGDIVPNQGKIWFLVTCQNADKLEKCILSEFSRKFFLSSPKVYRGNITEMIAVSMQVYLAYIYENQIPDYMSVSSDTRHDDNDDTDDE